MKTLVLNLGIALAARLGEIAIAAVDLSLRTQERLGGTPDTAPRYQTSINSSRDALLEAIDHLFQAEEHLATDRVIQQAALNMHTNGAAGAFMNVQQISSLLGLAADTRNQLEAVLNPPVITPEAEPIVTPAPSNVVQLRLPEPEAGA